MVAWPVRSRHEPSVCQCSVPLSGCLPVGLPSLSALGVLLVLVHHVDLNLAERAREGDLRGGGQVDIAEQDQLVVEKRLVHLAEHFRLDRLRERDPGNLAAERGVQRLDLERPVARGRLALCLSHRFLLFVRRKA